MAFPILIKFCACFLQTFITDGSGTRRADETLRRSYSCEAAHDVLLWNTGKNFVAEFSYVPAGHFIASAQLRLCRATFHRNVSC